MVGECFKLAPKGGEIARIVPSRTESSVAPVSRPAATQQLARLPLRAEITRLFPGILSLFITLTPLYFATNILLLSFVSKSNRRNRSSLALKNSRSIHHSQSRALRFGILVYAFNRRIDRSL